VSPSDHPIVLPTTLPAIRAIGVDVGAGLGDAVDDGAGVGLKTGNELSVDELCPLQATIDADARAESARATETGFIVSMLARQKS